MGIVAARFFTWASWYAWRQTGLFSLLTRNRFRGTLLLFSKSISVPARMALPMPITIGDIARHAAVSVSTVSKALNGYGDVSQATRERVLEAARQLDYHPSSAARTLRLQRTDKIGFLYSFPTAYIGEFASRMINGAVSEAEEQGFNLTLYPVREDWEAQLVRICRMRDVDGLLLMGSGIAGQMVALLSQEAMPCVVLNRRVEDPQASFVTSDHEDGGYQATRHLVEQGHRRIAHFTRTGLGTINDDRLAGYCRALAEAGIPLDPALLQETPMEPGTIRAALSGLLVGENPPTAAVAINDTAAVECLEAAIEHGLSVPPSFAVVGSDNNRISLTSTPPLTTLHPPLAEIGRRATRALLRQVLDREVTPERELLKARLIVRQSSSEMLLHS
jgi:LacI family transcriptional regulator